MKRAKKCCLFFLAVLLVFGAFPKLSAKAEGKGSAPLSPAISILAKKTDVAVWGLVSETQILDTECFLRGLNLSKIHSICIRSLPEATEGRLLFHGTAVSLGQTLYASELYGLSFEPASKRVAKSGFSFEINECGVEYFCNIFLLKQANASPSIAEIPTLLQTLYTHQNIAKEGRFFAEDPEGDPVSFEVVSFPQYGFLTVSGDLYSYRPFSNYTGEDAFSYVARDLYGNYSASVKISVVVNPTGETFVYSDVEDLATESALRTLTSAGVLESISFGSGSFFYPASAMTRAEFLVLAMTSAGITDLPACEDTGFLDDEKIAPAMKPYVAAAYRLGYLGGKTKAGGAFFAPEEAITKGEAASLVSCLLLPDAPKTQATLSAGADKQTERALSSLAALGVLSLTDSAYPANDALTRGEAVKLLERIFLLTHFEKI